LSVDFRATHHWLRGYSDALLGKDELPQDENYKAVYSRGYTRGLIAKAAI
jgi:hypothetical protein